ncbi:MAG: substrate-binding domain-containing protein [Pseudomonadota bacterium]
MNKTLTVTVTMALCLLGFLTMVGAQATGGTAIVRIKGSDDMAGRVDNAAKIYVKDHPGVTVVVSGGAKGTDFSELLDGSCEVMMLGRRLTDQDKLIAKQRGLDIVERLVGYGAVVFLTYPQNTVEELTVDQVQKLLRGDYADWSQVGGPAEPVTVISVEALGSDTRLFVMNDFLQVPAVRSKVERVSSFRTIIPKVSETKGAIGYSRMRDVEYAGDRMKAKLLKIKKDAESPAIMPSRASIGDGSYPIKRPFALYYNGKASGDVRKLVDYIASKGWGETKQ